MFVQLFEKDLYDKGFRFTWEISSIWSMIRWDCLSISCCFNWIPFLKFWISPGKVQNESFSSDPRSWAVDKHEDLFDWLQDRFCLSNLHEEILLSKREHPWFLQVSVVG